MDVKSLSEEKRENRSLSKVVRRRKENHKSPNSKSKWNPFKKLADLVTGGATKKESDPELLEVDALADDCVMRWTSTCLNATCPLFSKSPQFNMTYCTIPSLLMFICVKFSSENVVTKFMDRLFELTEQDLTELGEICEILQKCLSPRSFYCFVRFLVDEEKTTTVSKELMTQCHKLAGYKVFASIRPSRAVKYLNGLSFGGAELSRPALLTTNGYGSCGLVAKWEGKTKSINRQRFASTYRRMIMEPFFELSTKFRRIIDDQFEIFEIDFTTDDSKKSAGSLLIFRPQFIGNLPYSNRSIKSDTIARVMTHLEDAPKTKGTILLPQFTVNSSHDLWKNLLKQGVQPDLGQSHKLPPIASIHHWASLSVCEKGINAQVQTTKPPKSEKRPRGRISGELLYAKNRPYAARIDSSFTYIVLLKGIPIFAGSYFGHSPPRSSEIFIKAPDRIRKMRHRAPKKKYQKVTRKQNLKKKAKKNDEKDRAKLRKFLKKVSRSKSKSKSASQSVSTSATVSKSSKTSDTKSKSKSGSASGSGSGSAEPVTQEKKSKGIKKIFNIFKRK